MTAMRALETHQGWQEVNREDRYRQDGTFWTLQVPPIHSDHKTILTPADLESYCGVYEANPTNRMCVMTLESESLLPRAHEMQDDIKKKPQSPPICR